MLIFAENYSYDDPLNIVFLCGSHYSKKSKHDKRNRLKEHIDGSTSNLHAIILEENFQFASTSKQYLSYDDIYLSGLAQIEQLASLYASKIIIIHETISTAAELGMFAIDPILAQKICLLVPDKVSIEEEKISGFIRLAFFQEKAPENMVRLIRYYPDVEVHRTSPNKSDYYSYFHDNKIGTFLEKELESFLISGTSKRTIHFQKNRFYNSNNAPSVVDYTLSSTNQSIAISTHIEALKVHLLSMLGVDFIRKELRKEKEIRIHVNYIYNVYRDILRNTVESLTGIDAENFKVSVSLKGTNCTLKQAVGYFLYMLQAANLISLVQISAVSPTTRKIQLSTHLDKYIRHINDALLDIGTTEFGRLVT